MTMMTRTALGIAAGICGSLFLGYCIYFDKKRRSDPDFKEKLRKRRLESKKQQKKINPSLDLKDIDAVQRFFLTEVQLGEELLAQGDVENGVEHLSNAVAVCGQPQQLLQVLRQTLPPQVFHLLIEKLPAVHQRIMSEATLVDEELE